MKEDEMFISNRYTSHGAYVWGKEDQAHKPTLQDVEKGR
jgi:hypothetical protein